MLNTIIEFVVDNLSEMLVVAAVIAMTLRFVFYSRPQASGKRKPSYAERAGAAGEARVARYFRQHRYQFVHDVIFRLPSRFFGLIRGDSVQTDFIVRLPRSHALAVLEVKNYAGRLFGRAEESLWTHKTRDGDGREITLRPWNPLRQVARQADGIERVVGVSPVAAVVVNAGSGQFPDLRGIVALDDLDAFLADLDQRNSEQDTDVAWDKLGGLLARDNPGLVAAHVAEMARRKRRRR